MSSCTIKSFTLPLLVNLMSQNNHYLCLFGVGLTWKNPGVFLGFFLLFPRQLVNKLNFPPQIFPKQRVKTRIFSIVRPTPMGANTYRFRFAVFLENNKLASSIVRSVGWGSDSAEYDFM